MRRPGEASCPAMVVGHAQRTGFARAGCPADSGGDGMGAGGGLLVGSPTNRALGRAIRELRRERLLTIEGLGFTANVHPTYLSGIERGVRNPTWEKLCALADALEIPVADMARYAESVARVQEGLERVLEQERARSPHLPTRPVQDAAA